MFSTPDDAGAGLGCPRPEATLTDQPSSGTADAGPSGVALAPMPDTPTCASVVSVLLGIDSASSTPASSSGPSSVPLPGGVSGTTSAADEPVTGTGCELSRYTIPRASRTMAVPATLTPVNVAGSS